MMTRFFQFFAKPKSENTHSMTTLSVGGQPASDFVIDMNKLEEQITKNNLTSLLAQKINLIKEKRQFIEKNSKDIVIMSQEREVALSYLDYLEKRHPHFYGRHRWYRSSLIWCAGNAVGWLINGYVNFLNNSNGYDAHRLSNYNHLEEPNTNLSCNQIMPMNSVCSTFNNHNFTAAQSYCLASANQSCQELKDETFLFCTFSFSLGIASLGGILGLMAYQLYRVNHNPHHYQLDTRSLDELGKKKEVIISFLLKTNGISDKTFYNNHNVHGLKNELKSLITSNENSESTLAGEVAKLEKQMAKLKLECDALKIKIKAHDLNTKNKLSFFAGCTKSNENHLQNLPKDIINSIFGYVKPADFEQRADELLKAEYRKPAVAFKEAQIRCQPRS